MAFHPYQSENYRILLIFLSLLLLPLLSFSQTPVTMEDLKQQPTVEEKVKYILQKVYGEQFEISQGADRVQVHVEENNNNCFINQVLFKKLRPGVSQAHILLCRKYLDELDELLDEETLNSFLVYYTTTLLASNFIQT